MIHPVDTCTAMRRSLRAFVLLIFSDLLKGKEFGRKTYRISEAQIDYVYDYDRDACVMDIVAVLIRTLDSSDFAFTSEKEYHKLGQFSVGKEITPDTAKEIRTACRRVVTKLMLLHS